MRTLKFIVDGQIIAKDPNCNFDNLVPRSEGFMQARFSFSPEWDNCVKVVSFWSALGKEYPPQLLTDGTTCRIPTEALARCSYGVQVIGKGRDFKIITNKIMVEQDGGNK